ncbi:MAG TPA: VWA domain-containing protein [Polyangiaceae bacterium]|jgi:Ca-activated chloride channel homolog|nr:VWA domain-containing protein [Polyangiaceae bacterium]
MRTGWLVFLVGLIALWSACETEKTDTPQPEATGSTAPATGGIELNIVYGSEKKAWLQDAIQAFNASPAAKLDGKPIVVKGTPMGSGVIISEVVDGKTQPDVWSPASDLFRPLLNEAWTKKHGAAGGQKVVAPEGKRLVLTPLVIAMWKPMAQALGWPDKPVGWSDVLALSTDKKGWQSKGHPEWGLFKFGHTHPKFSNSGLLSVVAEAYAAVGETRGLTREKLQDEKVARFMRDIEGSIVHYGESTGFFADKMLTRGPSFLSAAVIYENLVVDSYRRPEFQKRELDIVAIYPKEGTFWNDHPYIVLDAPWVTEPKRKAAKVFLDFLLSEAQQRRAMTEYGFRPADPAIAVAAPIDAAHGVDPKQPKTLLDTPEADVVNAALDLWMKTKKTVDIMFVFDRSGSMQGDPLAKAKVGAKEFLSQLDDRDRVSLLPFNNIVPEAVDDPVELTKARDKITQGVDGIFADGGTALYDAIAAAHKKLDGAAKKEPKRIYAMVVLSDGLDRDSRTSIDALEQQIAVSEEATSPPVRLFTIAYGAEADPATLARIAERGGGASFKGDTASISEIYRGLASFF